MATNEVLGGYDYSRVEIDEDESPGKKYIIEQTSKDSSAFYPQTNANSIFHLLRDCWEALDRDLKELEDAAEAAIPVPRNFYTVQSARFAKVLLSQLHCHYREGISTVDWLDEIAELHRDRYGRGGLQDAIREGVFQRQPLKQRAAAKGLRKVKTKRKIGDVAVGDGSQTSASSEDVTDEVMQKKQRVLRSAKKAQACYRME